MGRRSSSRPHHPDNGRSELPASAEAKTSTCQRMRRSLCAGLTWSLCKDQPTEVVVVNFFGHAPATASKGEPYFPRESARQSTTTSSPFSLDGHHHRFEWIALQSVRRLKPYRLLASSG